MLRQPVCMTEILLQTTAAKHHHLTATGVIASKTALRQKLAVLPLVAFLLAVLLRQRPWLDPIARYDVTAVYVTLIGMLTILTVFVIVVNNLADNCHAQHAHRYSRQITVAIPRRG